MRVPFPSQSRTANDLAKRRRLGKRNVVGELKTLLQPAEEFDVAQATNQSTPMLCAGESEDVGFRLQPTKSQKCLYFIEL